MKSNLKKIGKLQDEILSELWENAVFNNESFDVLEDIIFSQSKKEKTKEASFVLATLRNRNLITLREQNLLRKTVVGFFGLSVGSHAVLAWMMESRADTVKIVDPDTIAPTNLNRLSVGWSDVGKKKTVVIKEKLLNINPYTTVISSVNTNKKSLEEVFDVSPQIQVVVDEIDDLEGKIILRRKAKEHKIPLISAVDVGDNVVLDIERYDLSPQPEMFLGRMPEIENIDFSKISELKRKKLIIKLVGFEKNSEKMLNSLLSIGKSIATWPQLGGTATIAGGVVTAAIKKIILREKVIRGRYCISLDDILVKRFNNNSRERIRRSKIEKVKEQLKIY